MIALASSMLGVPENPPPVKPPTNVFSVFFSDQMETWLLSATQMLLRVGTARRTARHTEASRKHHCLTEVEVVEEV